MPKNARSRRRKPWLRTAFFRLVIFAARVKFWMSTIFTTTRRLEEKKDRLEKEIALLNAMRWPRIDGLLAGAG